MESYEKFISDKAFAIEPCGFEPSRLPSVLKPFQRDAVRWSLRMGRSALFFDTGMGKAQPVDEVVLTPDGWVAIGSIRVGDMVIGSSGCPIPVTGVYPQGVRRVSKVVFSDGAECRCDNDHLWSVQTDTDACQDRGWRTMTTDQIRNTLEASGRSNWRVPLVSVKGEDSDLPIDPYVIGVLLGDGCLTQDVTPSFSSADQQIVNEVNIRLPDGFRVNSSKYGERCATHHIGRKRGDGTGSIPSTFLASLRDLGLIGTRSNTKFIPSEYLFASEHQRMDLLKGLMDTDGWTGTATQYTTTSKRLAHDVCQLVRSLGGTVRLSTKTPTYTYLGERKTGNLSFNLTIKTPFTPFLLERKIVAYESGNRNQPCRKIIDIIDCEDAECVCIQVCSGDSLYVTRDYVLTHNTLIQLTWASQVMKRTDKPVLILAPLAVGPQTVREAAKFKIGGVRFVHGSDEIDGPGIYVTNYEKLHKFDPDAFSGIVLDESSILKSHDGKTRTELIESFANTPFRLCCTATPSPNDHEELGNHCQFLGVMSRVEMLATFFVHDSADTGEWRLKGHAEAEFWRWVASWALVARRPSDLGHKDEGYDLPPLTIEEHYIETGAQAGRLIPVPETTLNGQRAARKRTMTERIAKATEIASQGDDQCLVWCELNDEGDMATDAIPDAVQVAGADSEEDKIDRLSGFAEGRYRILCTKPKIGAYGLNLQGCNRMVFVGLSHSYEQFYQAVRRCWRYGQTRPVTVHVITSELEASVLENIKTKQKSHEKMVAGMLEHTRDVNRANLKGTRRMMDGYHPNREMILPPWLVGSERCHTVEA